MLVEAVPNLSLTPEDPGLDEVLDALARAHEPGWALLDVHADKDHGRTVLTLAGAPAPLSRALEVMIETTLAVGDITAHQGVHPRVGLVDVLPLIPLHQARWR
ncbi:MAG: glutamate formimidoyltransferase, partial [Candidatus Thermoplasmatota archaeon]|nr:glutamate formimidoyltransferase [Candidatus Thermoplasmatota archaeon]